MLKLQDNNTSIVSVRDSADRNLCLSQTHIQNIILFNMMIVIMSVIMTIMIFKIIFVTSDINFMFVWGQISTL